MKRMHDIGIYGVSYPTKDGFVGGAKEDVERTAPWRRRMFS